jgi:tetratricopeptide (TPR) repeat protein
VFTGAGISCDFPTSLPTGKQLIASYLDAIGSRNPEIRNALRPEVILQAYNELNADVLKPLAYFKESSPNRNHYFLDLLAARKKISGIITTNLDICHEKARSSSTYEITHLHGQADRPRTIRYTLSQVAAGRNSKQLRRLAPLLGRNTLVIFLGYSGLDQFDIGPILRKCDAHLLWVQHSTKRSLIRDTVERDTAHYILHERQRKNWTFVEMNTWKFSETLASAFGIQGGFRAIDKQYPVSNAKRDEALNQFSVRVKNQFAPLSATTAALIEAHLVWRHLGHATDAIKRLAHLQPTKLSAEQNAHRLRILGSAYFRIGDYRNALANYRKLEGMSPLPSNIFRWQALQWLGSAEGRMRRYADARRHYNTALSIAKGPGERGKIYGDYGATEHIAGKRRKALAYYRRARELVNSDPYVLATISDSIGLLYIETEPRNYKLAEKHLKESVTIRENILHYEGLASAHLNLGQLYRGMYGILGLPLERVICLRE